MLYWNKRPAQREGQNVICHTRMDHLTLKLSGLCIHFGESANRLGNHLVHETQFYPKNVIF